jgi:GntR family transcriptional regulator
MLASMSDGNGGRAPYQQVAWEMRKKIEAGIWKPGDRIPSQRAIADEYGITPMTAAKAVRALCDEGWAVSTPSVGVHVSDPLPTGSTGSLADELRELRSQLDDLAQRVDRIELGHAPDRADK